MIFIHFTHARNANMFKQFKPNNLYIVFIIINVFLIILTLLDNFGLLGIPRKLCFIYSETIVSGSKASRDSICSGELIFEENFDDFDLEIWQHDELLDGGGTHEFQLYTNNRSTSFAEEGVLHLKPHLWIDEKGGSILSEQDLQECTSRRRESCWGRYSDNKLRPFKSAYIRTSNSFSFRYGVVEIKAQVASGDWLVSSLSLLPRQKKYSSGTKSGEITLLKGLGNNNLEDRNGENVGVERVTSGFNFGPTPEQISTIEYSKRDGKTFSAGFHVYKLEWTPESIKFEIDGELVGKVEPSGSQGFWDLDNFGRACTKYIKKNCIDNPWRNGDKIAPFDQEFYLVINLAIGGESFNHDEYLNDGKSYNISSLTNRQFYKFRKTFLNTWKTDTEESHFKVDYVKVWAL